MVTLIIYNIVRDNEPYIDRRSLSIRIFQLSEIYKIKLICYRHDCKLHFSIIKRSGKCY